MSYKEQSTTSQEAQEALLYSSRHGELRVVTKLLEAKEAGEITLNVSCKGQSKSNLGWTPLHLATYFGHIDVAEILLGGGADVNAANDLGDTALHKAAFIGREELVVLLLKHGADINIMNGEGRLPRDVCKKEDINRLLIATEQAEQRNRENSLLTAAREGNLDSITKLLSESQSPSINCVDAQGNTALHCAAYRGHAHVAVILLQNGVDSSIRNKTGQLAIDMARDSPMRDILSVRPVRQLQRTATRFEGPLMKRSRFLGWKPVWAVLQRGVLVYYGSRGEAAESEGSNSRRARKYLDGARVTPANTERAVMIIHYSDGDTHRLAVPTPIDSSQDATAVRHTWMTALKEHIDYSGHYLWAGGPREAIEELEDCRPLGSMHEALLDATSSIALFESQLRECGAIVTALEDSQNVGSPLYQSAYMRFQHVSSTGQRSLAALRHCCALVEQAREAADARVRDQAERTRVLEEALAALAREHHQLEMSFAEEVGGQSKKYKKKRSSPRRVGSNDSFFDAYEGDSDSDTLMTAGLSSPLGALSPWEETPESSPVHKTSTDLTPTNPASPRVRPNSTNLNDSHTGSFASLISPLDPLRSTDSVMSLVSSCGTLVSHGGHVYRDACDDVRLRVRHKPSSSMSQWSL